MSRRQNSRRRWIAAGLSVYAAILVSGAPLPIAWVASVAPAVFGDEADTADGPAERFPCEASPCGCSTAAHCWAKCCCHTLEERLAWARREGVRPPESALDAAVAEGFDVTPWREVRSARYRVAQPMAEKRELPPCCAARVAACKKQEAPENRESKPGSQGVSLVQALACQGLLDAWLTFGEAPIARSEGLLLMIPSAPRTEMALVRYEPFSECPTPPPPESWPAILV